MDRVVLWPSETRTSPVAVTPPAVIVSAPIPYGTDMTRDGRNRAGFSRM